ncbi:dodecin family protein [Gillisia sp. Q332]|uniref:dodecin family protein n=1 Tax=Gillisia xinjiangensis TaxID=3384765 RepID=UPI00391CDE9E
MSIFKVIEVIATSEDSWEEATRNAVKSASKTIKNIKSVYVKEQKAMVTGENITEFRVILKITFELT